MEKSLALVLRTIDYSNTSLVVTLWTREFGLVRAMARGGRRRSGSFYGSLDLLSLCEVVVIRKKSDSLDLLTRADLTDRFVGLRQSLDSVYSGMYVAELLAQLTAEHDPHPVLFDISRATLSHWSQRGFSPIWLFGFELSLLKQLGYLPEWGHCVHCRVPLREGQRVRFSMAVGGAPCSQCGPPPPGTRAFQANSGSLSTLDELSRKDWNCWDRCQIPCTMIGEIRRLLDHVFEHLLGRVPRTRAYLRMTARKD